MDKVGEGLKRALEVGGIGQLRMEVWCGVVGGRARDWRTDRPACPSSPLSYSLGAQIERVNGVRALRRFWTRIGLVRMIMGIEIGEAGSGQEDVDGETSQSGCCEPQMQYGMVE